VTDVWQVVQWIVTLIGAATIIGGGIFLVKGSFNKASMEALRQDNEDLRKRDIDKESRIQELETQIQTHMTEIDSLRRENDVLRSIIVSTKQLEHLDKAIGTLTASVIALNQNLTSRGPENV